MSRKTFIAGNWKMNTTLEEAVELAQDMVKTMGDETSVDVALCVPYISLSAVAEVLKGSNIKLGAQDVHWEEAGAYTGEISTAMLKSVGVQSVILGHSEPRQFFGETDETVNKKVKVVVAADLQAIVCVGELLEERENGTTEQVVETQVRGAYVGVSKEDFLTTVIAYEPVWAIGTGKTASPEQADEVHAFIRSVVTDMYDQEAADSIVIQYGGSMNPKNAKELLGKSNIDGGLIGGASLKAELFVGVVRPA